MDFYSLVSAMSADTYQKLVEAVATKRWADGTLLSDEQHAQSMQLVMAYQAKVLRSDEPFTIGIDGQMVVKSKAEMKQQLDAVSTDLNSASQAVPLSDDKAAVTIARFAHDDL
ncbi:MAG: YeaC family protein [Rheinheimera sp.]|jgi:uncharacterized protein YeaC (DUF1315 family)